MPRTWHLVQDRIGDLADGVVGLLGAQSARQMAWMSCACHAARVKAR